MLFLNKILLIMKKKKLTLKAASRIYSSTAKKHGGKIPKGSFAARAMRAAMKEKN